MSDDNILARWIGVLAVACVITGLLTFGIIPNQAIGLTRILFGVFAALLAASLALGILRR